MQTESQSPTAENPHQRQNGPAKLEIPFEYRLWDADECAEYLHKNKRVFLERYAAMPSFPKRIPPPNTRGGKSQPLWRAIEVVNWALKFQEKQ